LPKGSKEDEKEAAGVNDNEDDTATFTDEEVDGKKLFNGFLEIDEIPESICQHCKDPIGNSYCLRLGT